MTMFDPKSDAIPTGQDLTVWLHDQVSAIRASMGRMQQQGEQTQAAILDVNEKLRDAEGRIRELAAKTMGLPVMHDQVRQLSGVLERIQDAEVLIDTKFEILERQGGEERARDQGEKNDLYRRVQDLERRTESMTERQAGVDDAHRRFQEEVSRSHIEYQGMNQRLEAVETKAARSIDTATRLEQAMSELEHAIRALRREDDVLAERARLAHDIANRLETELHAQQEEYRILPLLNERVELLRAERQRLEDRVSHAAESVEHNTTRIERQEEFTTQLDTRMKAHDARIEHVHAVALDYRRSLTDQLLRLNLMLERMKRRQTEELDRDLKELRVQSNQLKNDENNDF